jgi:hypothetical protein
MERKAGDYKKMPVASGSRSKASNKQGHHFPRSAGDTTHHLSLVTSPLLASVFPAAQVDAVRETVQNRSSNLHDVTVPETSVSALIQQDL